MCTSVIEAYLACTNMMELELYNGQHNTSSLLSVLNLCTGISGLSLNSVGHSVCFNSH